MTDEEAAAYLSVTARTLRNYRNKGLLPFREVKGKTRPVIAYERADVERLKTRLDQRRQRSKKVRETRPAAPRVSFGMPPRELQVLTEEAKRYDMSPGEYARKLAREGLESRFREEAAEVRAELEKVKAENRKMRHEFSLAFEAVLEFVGLSPDDAKRWVNENLR